MKHTLFKIIFSSTLISLVISLAITRTSHAYSLSWNANTEEDLAGYKIYHKISSENYCLIRNVEKNITKCKLSELYLYEDTDYCFVVTAYDKSGNESAPSFEEINFPAEDYISDREDNCSDIYNPFQEDNYPPGGNHCGDACECEADLNGDGQVTGLDSILFKADYPRSHYLNEPCAVCIGGSNDGEKCLSDAECPGGDCGQNPINPCLGDLNCDMKVDGLDFLIFYKDYPRTEYLRVPCPECSRDGYPCEYSE